MDYLTAKETALKWNISSRMVAYYCKAGKVAGATKKGKTWLIPIHAEKPRDNRMCGNKVVIGDNPELQGDYAKSTAWILIMFQYTVSVTYIKISV